MISILQYTERCIQEIPKRATEDLYQNTQASILGLNIKPQNMLLVESHIFNFQNYDARLRILREHYLPLT